MTSLEKDTKWLSLKSPDGDDVDCGWYPHKITSINAHEFILSKRSPTWMRSQRFKYNIDTNTFNKCMYSDSCDFGNMAFDNKQQTLYIQNTHKIVSINIKTNNSNHLLGAKYGNYFLFINNHFHAINSHDSHWIGCIQNNSLNTL
eukprot:106172_1